MATFIITRTSPNTGRKLFLTESRSAGVSFEAPGNTHTGVGVACLKSWKTRAGAQKWLDARPTFVSGYATSGITVAIEENAE